MEKEQSKLLEEFMKSIKGKTLRFILNWIVAILIYLGTIVLTKYLTNLLGANYQPEMTGAIGGMVAAIYLMGNSTKKSD